MIYILGIATMVSFLIWCKRVLDGEMSAGHTAVTALLFGLVLFASEADNLPAIVATAVFIVFCVVAGFVFAGVEESDV